jgi:hypothetical protein
MPEDPSEASNAPVTRRIEQTGEEEAETAVDDAEPATTAEQDDNENEAASAIPPAAPPSASVFYVPTPDGMFMGAHPEWTPPMTALAWSNVVISIDQR